MAHARQPRRHLSDRARLQGPRGRLRRSTEHAHRHVRIPIHHHRRPGVAPGHACPRRLRDAEERRLLYVALTRARRSVTLITDPGRISPFVVELLDSGNVTVDGASLATESAPMADLDVCPKCGRGVLVARGTVRQLLGVFDLLQGAVQLHAVAHAAACGSERLSSGDSAATSSRRRFGRQPDNHSKTLQGRPSGSREIWLTSPCRPSLPGGNTTDQGRCSWHPSRLHAAG